MAEQPAAGTAAETARSLIEIHRQWIRDIGRRTGLTPTQIARQVGLTPTTLTRLVNDPDHPHALSARTVDKIVRKLNVAPPAATGLDAFRQAVWNTVYFLHRENVLQEDTPERIADTVLELADWLAANGASDQQSFSAVISFQAERLKRGDARQ